tara:strand:+ start:445 stop:1392 length:948 start_codon:yes stop_codon:yes gene_type:complete
MTEKYPIKITIGPDQNYENYSFDEFSITNFNDVKVNTKLINKQILQIKKSGDKEFGEIRLNSVKYTIAQIHIQRKDGLEINGHQIELQLVIAGISKKMKTLFVVIPIYSFSSSSYSNNFFRDIVNVAKKPTSHATINTKEIIPKAPYYRYTDNTREYIIFNEMDGISMNSDEYDQFFDKDNVDVGLDKNVKTAIAVKEAPNRGKREGEDEVSLKYNTKGTSGLKQTYSKNMTCKPVFSSDGSPIKVNEDTAPKTSPFIEYIVGIFGGADTDNTAEGFTLIFYYFLGGIIALIFFVAILFLFKMIIDKIVKVNITT